MTDTPDPNRPATVAEVEDLVRRSNELFAERINAAFEAHVEVVTDALAVVRAELETLAASPLAQLSGPVKSVKEILRDSNGDMSAIVERQ